jgi:hypothetical protein
VRQREYGGERTRVVPAHHPHRASFGNLWGGASSDVCNATVAETVRHQKGMGSAQPHRPGLVSMFVGNSDDAPVQAPVQMVLCEQYDNAVAAAIGEDLESSWGRSYWPRT